jgi:hypothetical protein
VARTNEGVGSRTRTDTVRAVVWLRLAVTALDRLAGPPGAGTLHPERDALTTRYVADEEPLHASGVTGTNFALPISSELLERVAKAVVDGRIVTRPITRISLEEVPAVLSAAQERPARGKTVITL